MNRNAVVARAVMAVAAVALGAGAVTAGPAAASEVTEHGFYGGPSCDPAVSAAMVIAETADEKFVICRQNGVFPPDDHMITALNVKPLPFRYDDVKYGPQTYVVDVYGKKLLVGRGYSEFHDEQGKMIWHKPTTEYRFQL
ncbi:hypothetical protein [Tsukamurella sp. PLM1]|uniref:hypothetical protein n=1 Tax=Tsukamurella sp. PLM1 TaxID=2929795 RepID=UPI002061319F|nr:hypothetical protein [Tsukamurella sp. PLM1]BDH59233.1 hypothetical protein MTP03_41720 [Tsukamurella sp. PLM1]